MKAFCWSKDQVTQSASYPESRLGHTLTYIPDKDAYILFGGAFTKPSIIYLYDAEEHKWSEQEVKGKLPQLTRFH